MSSPNLIVIPARYQSSRFPGKPLALIHGKPMIQRVYEQCSQVGNCKVVIATDDKRIEKACIEFGANVFMTQKSHISGTDRVAEVAKYSAEYRNIINVQGDEPCMHIEQIEKVINLLNSGANIATLKKKKINKKDFKKYHPSGTLGTKLKTVEDIMITGKKIPIIDENDSMKKALEWITKKRLGTLIVTKKSKLIGIITDGQIRRKSLDIQNLQTKKVKDIMTKNPITINKDVLAMKALGIMNSKKITSLCIIDKNQKVIGIIHIHNILENSVN
mgnify:CR=1 FL=1